MNHTVTSNHVLGLMRNSSPFISVVTWLYTSWNNKLLVPLAKNSLLHGIKIWCKNASFLFHLTKGSKCTWTNEVRSDEWSTL